MSPTGAVAHEKATGALPRASGPGAPTAEAELADTIAELGHGGPPASGRLRIGITTPLVAFEDATPRTYGYGAQPAAGAYFETTFAALALLARAIEIE
jgi:hypothetical protein